MSARKKKLILFPLGGVVLAALALFLLGRFGVIDAPWIPGSVAAEAAEADGENGDGGKNGEDEEEIVPVPVELARAEARRISAYYRAASFVEADRQVDLVTKIAGRVQRVDVEEGDWVHEGDVLVELENSREKIRLRQAELKQRDQERELDRRESLLEKNLITRDEFEDTRSAVDLAIADRDLAEISVEETVIRAPFDGQVTQRFVVPGQHIEVSEPVFKLVDFDPLRIRINLPEVVARKISPGDAVQVVAEALDVPVAAEVERISPVVDPTTSTVRLTLLVDENIEELRVGGFVKVRVMTDTHTEALSIPKLALVEEGGMRSVFVAEEDTVRKVEIRTGLYDESHIEVLDGVEEGAYVVSLGQGGLRTGSRVEVLNATQVGWVSPASEDTTTAEADAGGENAAGGEDGAADEANGDDADDGETGRADSGEELADAGESS
jgi:membrane fusion protein (multidrug efflux system)